MLHLIGKKDQEQQKSHGNLIILHKSCGNFVFLKCVMNTLPIFLSQIMDQKIAGALTPLAA